MFTQRYLWDLAERVAWTCAQAAIGVVITASSEWPPIYAVGIATGLAVVKGLVAQHIGNPESASMLPSTPPD